MNIANPEMKLYFDTFALVKEFVNETGSTEVKHYVEQKFIKKMSYYLRLSLLKPGLPQRCQQCAAIEN